MRVTTMSLLSEMRDKLTKSLTVCVDVKALNNQLLDNLHQIISTNNEKYPAKSCTLKFKVKDGEESIYVDLASKSYRVSPSDDLMAEIYSLTNTQAVLL
jgi:DNA polymerase-3 subunit alpha